MALCRLGHEVVGVPASAPSMLGTVVSGDGWVSRLARQVGGRLGKAIARPWELMDCDEHVSPDEHVRVLAGRGFDVLWVESAGTLRGATLAEVQRRQPGAAIVLLLEESRSARGERWLESCAHCFDVVYSVAQCDLRRDGLSAQGARNVAFVPRAYDPMLYQPPTLEPEARALFGSRVGFFGDWDAGCAAELTALAGAGCRVRVFGAGWSRLANRSQELVVENRTLVGAELARAIGTTDVNLGLLPRSREHSELSVQVPACGGFLLAPRTRELTDLFQEGREAIFYGDQAELLKRLCELLSDDVRRREIARVGRLRARAYSHDAVLARILEESVALRQERLSGREARARQHAGARRAA